MDWRLRLIKSSIIFGFFIVALRLGQIMILDHAHYKALAYDQHVVEQELIARRGEIYTHDNYPLVINADTYLLFAVPKEMEDKGKSVDILYKHIDEMLKAEPVDKEIHERLYVKPKEDEKVSVDVSLPITIHKFRYTLPLEQSDWPDTLKEVIKEELSQALEDDSNQYVQMIVGLDRNQKQSIEKDNSLGLHFQANKKRSYPEGTFAAHVLGFVGKNVTGRDTGYFGLEGFYDGDLSGRSGYVVTETDVNGRPIPYGEQFQKSPSHGRDLILTIERELQYLLEKRLEEGVKKYDAKNGTAILLEPNTGRILAMANYPTYLPEYWSDELKGESDVGKVEVFRNLSIGGNYEPGSVIKPITLSMALNEGLVTPSITFDDVGPVVYSGFSVRTWNNRYLGTITMTEILQHSNNTGAAWVGHRVGFETFAKYIDAFNFGSPTGIDLQGEEWGIVRDQSMWRDIDLANMSFGQGISVTPLQMVSAFSSLINGGNLYKPHIVDTLIDYDNKGNKTEIVVKPEIISEPISQETSEMLRLMLRKVVTDGEFKWFVKNAGMEDYSIGGKTGTAQIPVNGAYDPHKTNTTFVGFAPIDDPQFVLIMKLSEPTTSSFSADTVVPLWFQFAQDLMVYFQIEPA
ncbi:penicillin-binding protein 2 [bacterium]|uniref:Penicillin-binding protein 2 n=1 Tax=candidate division WWE3 bacterium CG_4_9_14_3_um_filter_39_7 TaxID=1975080 RepID=A0A2M7X3P9_UNCKA|nr:penicillin-binding protein 2 [bacterium]PJA40792.1 MAG: hypothetical protein CO179_01370 [candidate division WWE3 bacterium CG_4_9_14_3_um_filter_39_7]